MPYRLHSSRRSRVRDHMACVTEQRKRSGPPARQGFDHRKNQGDEQGQQEGPAARGGLMRVMLASSVSHRGDI